MRFYSTMTRRFRRDGPPLVRTRRALSVLLGPMGVVGALFAPIVVLPSPLGLVTSETEWVRVAGLLGSLLTSTLGALAAWALASDVRAGWRRGAIDLDTVAFMCGFGLTPVVIGLYCYAAGIGAAR